MIDDSDTNDTFTTDSSPGEQEFESTVDDAVASFEASFEGEESVTGPRTTGVLRSCVRAALKSEGSASPEHVAHAARVLSERYEATSRETVEPVLRRVEEMIDDNESESESGNASASASRHHRHRDTDTASSADARELNEEESEYETIYEEPEQ